jgi:hypothetical protein
MGLLWLALGLTLILRPGQLQAASKRFERRESWIPIPPLVGIPLWAVRPCGIVSTCGALLFFYLFAIR